MAVAVAVAVVLLLVQVALLLLHVAAVHSGLTILRAAQVSV